MVFILFIKSINHFHTSEYDQKQKQRIIDYNYLIIIRSRVLFLDKETKEWDEN